MSRWFPRLQMVVTVALVAALLAAVPAAARTPEGTDDVGHPNAVRLAVGEHGAKVGLDHYLQQQGDDRSTVYQLMPDGEMVGALFIESDGTVEQSWKDEAGNVWRMSWTSATVTKNGVAVTDFSRWSNLTYEQFIADPVGRSVAAGQAAYEDLELADRFARFAESPLFGGNVLQEQAKAYATLVCDEGNWVSCAGRAGCLSGAEEGFCEYWCSCQTWLGVIPNCRMTCCCGYQT